MSAFIPAGALLPLRVSAQAQSGQAASGLGGDDVGSIVVGVHAAGGAALDAMATVNVYTQSHQLYSSATVGPGSSRFDGVPLGTYVVEANVPGYFPAEEQIELMMQNDQRQVSLALRLLSDPSSTPVLHKTSIACAEGTTGALEGARRIARKPSRESPEASRKRRAFGAFQSRSELYLLGVVALQSDDPSSAIKYWQRAISFFPEHVLSLVALGETTLTGR
jgi:hypothetical protein